MNPIAVNATSIDTGLWAIQRYGMQHYGTDAAAQDIAPLKWYINTGRAPLEFTRKLLNAKPFSQLITEEPERLEYYITLYVDLLKKIHCTDVPGGQLPVLRPEGGELGVLPAEGADDPDAGQVFPGPAQQPVQGGLHLRVERDGQQHDAEQRREIMNIVQAIHDYFDAARKITPEYQQEAFHACIAAVMAEMSIG